MRSPTGVSFDEVYAWSYPALRVMRLQATGAVVRFLSNARLARQPRLLLRPICYSRNNSTTTAFSNSPFGSRLHPPRAAVSRRLSINPVTETSTPRSRFEAELQAAEDNKIVVGSNGLKGAKILDQPFVFDETSNIGEGILGRVGRNLYDQPNHPLCITRRLIESVFRYPTYKNHVATNPVVTVKDNFDVLGFPQDHPGRSTNDTYYVDATHVLRTHTSAHQHAAFEYMIDHPELGYTICADVYRKDSIDRSHCPTFHQMEGAHLWKLPEEKRQAGQTETKYNRLLRRSYQIEEDILALPKHGLEIVDEAGEFDWRTNPPQVNHDLREVGLMGQHLKRSLELLIARVFTAAKEAGVDAENTEPIKIRWIEAHFPFTSPSWELEVWWQGEWLELLGCGIVQQNILDNAGLRDRVGWAWGIGVERLAMLLFGIPDIRLFWSQDPRFLQQFSEGKVTRYEAFSKHPTCYKDVAFWLPSTSPTATPLAASPTSGPGTSHGVAQAAGGDASKSVPKPTPTQTSSPSSSTSPTASVPSSGASFHENDLMEIVRDIASDLAEDVRLIDEFINPKTGRKSLCYRINYRSLERTLTNKEVNSLHEGVRDRLVQDFGVQLR